ncbi:DUF3987 domain-containing protein [Bacteroides sp.]|uniref:DUF3987 domain-containing protein n=1 Tax=Bacteroides sp. TaxID=29523 RepID=UPI002A81976C|nr:DUF3987 domain-containing protein [Bacteroides sp.]
MCEQLGTDIAPSYEEWVRLGFALVDGYGEKGRDYFLRLSSLHTGYTPEAAESQYDKCLRSGNSGITISTFFHLAKQTGISISIPNGKMAIWQNGNLKDHADNQNNTEISKSPNCQDGNMEISEKKEEVNIQNTKYPYCQNGKTDISDKWIFGEEELPLFPEDVYTHLPPFLDSVMKSAISPSDRDMLLIGAITVLSSTLGKVSGVYDERIVYPNLYLFVSADAGMGKGALPLCREIVAPINAELRAVARLQSAEADSGKEKDTPMLALIIPANSSASAFIKTLADNNGTGLMFETEGDTLSQTLKSDYGNYSDTLRKAFHHEPVSLCRRKDREFLEVDCPKLSVVLAGTPGQVRNLIQDSENGLFSRFIFFNIKFERNIRDVFVVTDSKKSKTEVFRQLGEQYKELLGKIQREASGYEMSIPLFLHGHFMEHYNQLNNECCEAINNRMQGVVRRNGLMAFRIMMVLTIVRHLTDDLYHPMPEGQPLRLECSEEDYHTSLTIARTLLYHSAYMFRQLEKPVAMTSSSNRNDRREMLYGMLPDCFTKQEYLSVVRQLEYSESTCNKWIDRYIAENLLRHCGHSKYEKVRKDLPETPSSTAPA